MVLPYIAMREEHHEEGHLRLERVLQADAGGKLHEIIALTRGIGAPLLQKTHEYKTVGTADIALQAVDDHWERLQSEFADINEEAAYYYYVKKGISDGSGLQKFQLHTSAELGEHLLEAKLTPEEIESGQLNEKNFPITHISHRMNAMRYAADDADISLDVFEEAIETLRNRTLASADAFDAVLDGHGTDDEAKDEQPLPGDHDDGEGRDWEQVGEDFDRSQWEEVSEQELAAVPTEEDEKAPPTLHSWEDDDFDPDDERDENLRAEMEDYINYMTDFTVVANELWRNAVTRIADGDHVLLEEDKIHEMETIRQHAQEAYDIFKQQAENLGFGAYELKPVFDRFEDPDRGTEAMMNKIIRMASKPKKLETAIRKSLTPPQEEHGHMPDGAEVTDTPPPANDNGAIRNSDYKNGTVAISREVILDHNGMPLMKLGMRSEPDNRLLKDTQWKFPTATRAEMLLDNMDAYWDKLCEEMDSISKQSRAYGLIKSRGKNDRADSLAQKSLYILSENLLSRPVADHKFIHQDLTDEIPPLTTINQRFKAVRTAAGEMDMDLDGFEKAVLRLSTDMHEAMNSYDDIRMGMDKQPPAELVGGGDEFHPEDHHDDDKPKWEPEPSDAWKKGSEDSIPASEWEKERDKEESRQDDHKNLLVTELIDQLNGFMGTADQIWMQAATQLSKGDKVSVGDKQLEQLRYWMQETETAYEALRESTESAPDAYKLHDIFEGLEDEKTGFKAQMQKIISVASRPDLLEDTIQKALPQQHKK